MVHWVTIVTDSTLLHSFLSVVFFYILLCLNLLWYPVFVPQIGGEPGPPGELIEKVSTKHWPTLWAKIWRLKIFYCF